MDWVVVLLGINTALLAIAIYRLEQVQLAVHGAATLSRAAEKDHMAAVQSELLMIEDHLRVMAEPYREGERQRRAREMEGP